MSTFGNKTANDTGDWQNNKEMNPAANSSVTEDGLLEDEGGREEAWRQSGDMDHGISAGVAAAKDPNSQQSTASGAYKNDTGDPGRTPGKAEGVEDPEEDGNEE